MNRTLKTFFLRLFVSSVSFVCAQEADEKDIVKGGKGVTDAAKDGKAGTVDINMGLTAKDKPVEVAKTPMSEAGKDALRAGKDGQELEKGQKGSFWSRLFGKKKVKKEDDPN